MTQDTTPPGRFSKLGYSAQSMIPVPNDSSSESCRWNLSNDTLFGADSLWIWSNRTSTLSPGSVLSCVTYGIRSSHSHGSCLPLGVHAVVALEPRVRVVVVLLCKREGIPRGHLCSLQILERSWETMRKPWSAAADNDSCCRKGGSGADDDGCPLDV